MAFGSVALFALTLLLIRRWSPSATSYAFVVIPVVTLLLEAAVAGVPLTSSAPIGAVLVVVGVWFGALAPAPSERPTGGSERAA